MSHNALLDRPLLWSDAENREDVLPHPSREARIRLAVQRTVGLVLLIPFAGLLVVLMRWVRGYRIDDMQRLRREFAALTRERQPLIICANHLTFIDSALMIWAFGSNWRYLLSFRRFSWNLPAGDFFKKRFYFRLVAYLCKCIFIHRDGTKEHKNGVLGRCHYLLGKGEIVSLFPEGRRSRIGRFDREKVTYGIGKLLAARPGCRVFCVYLRGDKQENYSDYPAKNSRFTFRTRLVVPNTDATGRDAYFALTSQVADTLLALEKEWFALQ